MQLRILEVFHAIMQAGSVTGAARMLRREHPALTEPACALGRLIASGAHASLACLA